MTIAPIMNQSIKLLMLRNSNTKKKNEKKKIKKRKEIKKIEKKEKKISPK